MQAIVSFLRCCLEYQGCWIGMRVNGKKIIKRSILFLESKEKGNSFCHCKSQIESILGRRKIV